MKTYIPAHSEIAVRSTKAGATSQWYTTKKNVEIPGRLCDVKVVDCPMRTGVRVMTITHEGFDLFFQEDQVVTHLEPAELEAAKGLELYKLEYDLNSHAPSRITDADGTVHILHHPSTWLWAAGAIRTTESIWVIPAKNLQSVLVRFNRLRRVGAKWDATKQDYSEVPKLMGQCVQALQREFDAKAQRMEASRQSEERKLGEIAPTTENLKAMEKAEKAFLSRTKSLKKEVDTLYSELADAAKTFGISASYLNTARARVAANATHQAMMVRARLFSDAIDAVRKLPISDAAAVAAAAESGEMPPEVLADYIQENVSESQGETLRDAFAGKPVSDDEIFSLDNDAA